MGKPLTPSPVYDPPNLSVDGAAEILGVLPSTLRQWRWQKKGPAHYKIGGLVRYRRSDVIAYLEAGRFEPEAGR